jgi:hypothetical protein
MNPPDPIGIRVRLSFRVRSESFLLYWSLPFYLEVRVMSLMRTAAPQERRPLSFRVRSESFVLYLSVLRISALPAIPAKSAYCPPDYPHPSAGRTENAGHARRALRAAGAPDQADSDPEITPQQWMHPDGCRTAPTRMPASAPSPSPVRIRCPATLRTRPASFVSGIRGRERRAFRWI